MIWDKVECYIIVVVEKKCFVVFFKCIWRVENNEIECVWNWICEKRDECDWILLKLSEVCFFFLVISIFEIGCKKKMVRLFGECRWESGDDLNEEFLIYFL